MTPHLCIKDAHKPREHASWNSYPISDQNLWFSPPYFRPEALEPGAWPERVTICYGQTPVVGVNIKKGNGLIAKWWRSSFSMDSRRKKERAHERETRKGGRSACPEGQRKSSAAPNLITWQLLCDLSKILTENEWPRSKKACRQKALYILSLV